MTEETDVPPLESTLLLRHEDFDELLNIAAQRGAERCLAHLGLENGHAARTSANCATYWKRGAMPVAQRGKPR